MSLEGLNLAEARLILPQPAAAARNMALDQAILQQTSADCEAGKPPVATLRFYTWDSPTLSLGYFQQSSAAVEWLRQRNDVKLVRRSTGGGAILHHHELTYSVTIPTPPGDSGARTELYRTAHAVIADTLGDHSIIAKPYREDTRLPGSENAFLCFQRRTAEDLIVSGYKVLGSAQRRARRAVIQHGSLLLRSSHHAPALPGIFDLTSRSLDLVEMAEQIADRFSRLLNVQLANLPVTEQENLAASEIQHSRFESPDWWNRR